MENTMIMEITVIHNEKLTKKYLTQMRQNFYLMLIVAGILEFALLAIALSSGSEAGFAWGVFALVALCVIILSMVNIKGLQNCKFTLAKFEGATYNYKFYEDKFIVKYNFQNKEQIDEIKYELINNLTQSNGLVSIVLINSSLLFIDEELIEDHESFEKILYKMHVNKQSNQSKKKKRKKR